MPRWHRADTVAATAAPDGWSRESVAYRRLTDTRVPLLPVYFTWQLETSNDRERRGARERHPSR